MKRLNKIMLLALIFTGYTIITRSQNLDSIPKVKRDSILIARAKEVVLTYGPDYYREYKKPVIERSTVPPKGSINTTGKNAGRGLYSVIFLYDKTKELLAEKYAATVNIWADTGKPAAICFGNGIGLSIGTAQNRKEAKEAAPIPYQPLPPPSERFRIIEEPLETDK
jgi:hypothetical protein